VQDVRGHRAATELLFLHRGSLFLRAAIVGAFATGCGIAGLVLLRVHMRLAARLASGVSLSPIETLVAAGSSWRTAWPGWLAAIFFLIALIRLRRGPLEPPPGRRRPELLTPAQLRRGLRAEYLVVRLTLVALTAVAAVDVARATAHVVAALRGDHTIAASIPATIVEAAGFVVASLVLAAWAWTFGADVRRLGAM